MTARHVRSALVVDDDELVCAIVAQTMEQFGVDVVTASDGVAARRLLGTARRFDLIVIDLRMPGMDGIELLRDLSVLQDDVALILISAVEPRVLRAAEQIAHARQLHLIGSLPKPISPIDLGLLVQQVTPRTKPVRPDWIPPVPPDELREALANEEINVYAQPKLSLTGHFVGAEVLARWIRPDGKVLLPSAFLVTAEQHGLLDELTRAVFRQALRAQRLWRDQGLTTTISINLPSDSLDQLDLPEKLDAEVSQNGTLAEQVILEITESGVMRDLARSLDVVTRLRLRGYRLSIDDFGIGYSSLAQLARFPFSELKVDRAFVHGASKDQSLRSIVEASVRLAQDLKLMTCAEGVETQADYELIRDLGCDSVQGFYVARPMPTHELPNWVRTRDS